MSYLPQTGSANRLRRPALGELQGPDYSAKRQRVLQPLYGTPSSSLTGDEPTQEPLPDADDVIEHLARHGGKIKELEQANADLERRVQDLTADLEAETHRRRALQADLTYARELNAQPNHAGEQLEQLLHQEKQRRVSAEDTAAQQKRLVEGKDKQLLQLEQHLEAARQQLAQERRGMREEVSALQQRLAEAQERARQQLQSGQAATASARRQAKQEAARAEELDQQLQREGARCQQLTARLLAAETGSAHQVVAACQQQAQEGRVEELEALVASLRQQLRADKVQPRTSPRAQAGGPSAAVLQEQLAVAQRELTEAGRQRAEHLRVTAAHAQLEVEVAAWRDAAKMMGAGRPAEAKAAFEKLHTKVLQQQAEAGGLRAEMRKLVLALEDAQRERAAAEQLLAERSKALQEAEAQLGRVRAVVGALAQERETLQRLLASYKQLPEDGAVGPEAAQVVVRCQLLEEELQASRRQHDEQVAQVRGLLEDMGRLQGEQQELRDALRGAQAAQATAEERATRFERDLANRAREVDALQKRLGQGEHHPSLSRCLQLVDNPLSALMAQQTQERVRALAAENEALRQQLEASGGGGSQGGVELAAKEAEARLQRQRADDTEKQLRRTKAVVKERLQSIREAVLQLFGYKMALSSGDPESGAAAAPTYILHPANHPDPNATLIFRLTEGRATGRSWELLPTAYSKQLASEVDTYIDRFRSIPAFTANITMDLFNTQDAD